MTGDHVLDSTGLTSTKIKLRYEAVIALFYLGGIETQMDLKSV